jgi:hypothetical protein
VYARSPAPRLTRRGFDWRNRYRRGDGRTEGRGRHHRRRGRGVQRRTYSHAKQGAIEAARHLKFKNPTIDLTVRDLKGIEEMIVIPS